MPFSKSRSGARLRKRCAFLTGKERDSESANDYFGARYYWNGAGRWLSVDRLAGDVTYPQRLNRYAYALNDPVNYIDEGGADPKPFVIKIIINVILVPIYLPISWSLYNVAPPPPPPQTDPGSGWTPPGPPPKVIREALGYDPTAGLAFFMTNPARNDCITLMAKYAKKDLNRAMKDVIWLKLPLVGDVRWWELPSNMNPIPWDQTIREYFERGWSDNVAETLTRDGFYTGHIVLGDLFFLTDMSSEVPTSGLDRSDMLGHEFFHFVTEQGDRQLAESLGLGKFEKHSHASKAIQAFIESGCK